MIDVFFGRSDLLQALKSNDPELINAIADFLDLEQVPQLKKQTRAKVNLNIPADVTQQQTDSVPRLVSTPTPFLQQQEFLLLDQHRKFPLHQQSGKRKADSVPQLLPIQSRPLTTHSQFLTTLRKSISHFRETGTVDIERLVQKVCRGELLDRIPRRKRPKWGQSIHLIVDNASRLVPYFGEYEYVEQALKKVFPHNAILRVVFDEHSELFQLTNLGLCHGIYQIPDEETVVLALSDLGCLEQDQVKSKRLQSIWSRWGKRFQQAGIQPISLMPTTDLNRFQNLNSIWKILPWAGRMQPNLLTQGVKAAIIQRLLRLLSLASRVEPGLLREVRKLIPETASDPAWESLVWQQPVFCSRHCVAASFYPEEKLKLQNELNLYGDPLTESVWKLVKRSHIKIYEGVQYHEYVSLTDPLKEMLLTETEETRALQWLRDELNLIQQGTGNAAPEDANLDWFLQALILIPTIETKHAELSQILHDLTGAVAEYDESFQLPRGTDPNKLRSTDLTQTYDLYQRSSELHIQRKEEAIKDGSWLGTLRSTNNTFQIAVDPCPNKSKNVSLQKPPWASRIGHDEFGTFAELEYKQVTQRMRWIPPGRFEMGSPVDEPGRYDDEVQHEVNISHGFWMFDTPCTQDFWESVMGSNPSKFNSPMRPVEQVSWEDCHEFFCTLNIEVSGITFGLPSEAQWEYACRARTKNIRYGEPNEIAWYNKNSNNQTHPVKSKLPNRWGLYDMLGNVREWCQDWYSEYYYQGSPIINPPGPVFGTNLVFRGGGWSSRVRSMRCAYRNYGEPSLRSKGLGFRCVAFSQSEPVADGSGSEPRAEQGEDQAPPEARELFSADLRHLSSQTISLPALGSITVKSDLEQIKFDVLTKPAWANDLGRDRFGLFAELKIKRASQRLRWIPPGRFEMGSPVDEPDRFEREGPQHEVILSRGFWMFETACTQALWEAVMGNNPSEFILPTRPVEQVSWEECQEFIGKMNEELSGLELGLPSESQWEYACRAGSEAARYGELDEIAWYDKNSKKQTHPVKSKGTNAWGLYDMLGNVWEWCHDWYDESYYQNSPTIDPRGPSSGSFRVVRGGSWFDRARGVRCAYRYCNAPGLRYYNLGFRCVEFSQSGLVADGSGSEPRAEQGEDQAPPEAREKI